MDPLTGIAAAGTLYSMFSNNADRQQNMSENLMNYQYLLNKKALKDQEEAAMRMFENTGYAARVDQLKRAGLNPGLIYSAGAGGGGGVTGNISAPQVSGQQAPNVMAETANKISIMGMGLQLAKLKSEIKVNESIAAANTANAEITTGAKTELTQSQTIGQNIQNKFNEINTEIAERSKEINVQKIETLANQAKTDFENSIQTLIQNKTKSAEDIATLQSKIDQYNANVKKTVAETINTQIKSYEVQQNITESINKIAQGWVDKNLTAEQMKVELQKTLMNNNVTLDVAQLQSLTNILSALMKK